ncbi:MAG: glycosyltransferase family 4 protein [Kiritimatiellaeota bacterium]|nr:glycosyltransferase family 4 protein [Kiritimatiellota bacterium]
MNTRRHMPGIVMLAEACCGGVWRHLTLVAPGLAERGVAVRLILSPLRTDLGFDEDLEQLRAAGCTVDLLPMLRRPAPVADLRAVAAVRRVLRSSQPCVLHTHAAKGGLVGRLAAVGLHGVRTVHSPHAFFFEAWPHGIRRRAGAEIERFLGRLTDAYVLVSNAERGPAVEDCGVPARRLRVIENGLPESFHSELLSRAVARERLGIADSERAVGFVGRICAQKGVDLLVGAAGAIVGQEGTRSLRFHMVGDGPDRVALEQEVARLGASRYVAWHGHRRDAARLWPAFDLAVFPSRYEALPYALIEALAAGTAVLVSDIPGHFPKAAMREQLARFESGSARALATALQELLCDKDCRREAARWGRALVRNEFGLDRQVSRLEGLYRSLSDRP